MLPIPKAFLHVGTRVLTSRAAKRFRRKSGAAQSQQTAHQFLIRRLSDTSFWKKNGIEKRQTYEKFRERVPLRTYEDLTSPIEQMKRGASDVLWPGRCDVYAVSSGTTAGRTKYLPVTPEMLDHFRKAGLDSLLAYTSRIGHARVFEGKHLFLGGSTALAPIAESKPFEAWAGDLSGIAALNLPAWVDRHLYEPGGEVAEIADWPEKIEAIANRTLTRNITLIAGIPSWVLILAEAVRRKAGEQGRNASDLQAVWPKLECFVHGGVPIAPFEDELRATLGRTVNFHEVYPASEGFIAAQDAEASAGLRLFADAGIFYEFLPASEYDEAQLPGLGPRALPLADVKADVDYVLIMTTPGGLARYVIGDVVRFVSTEPPRLVYVGRTKLQLSAFGEHVIEKEITDALSTVCRVHGWTTVNFHVAPLFASSMTGRTRGRHEWWIELKPGTRETPMGSRMATQLDMELKRMNEDYEAKRIGGGLEEPVVRLVAPGVFEKWMRENGKWGGQSKMPRCRSDRSIADGLSTSLHFAND